MAKAAPEIPNKLFYKIGEVCEITDTQPYVLRFWESEFPQLAPRKNRSGQRVYQRKDIDTVIRIKKLLYEEEYTIAGARRKLDDDPVSAGDSSRAEAQVADAPDAPIGTEDQVIADDEVRTSDPPTARSQRASAEQDHPVDLLTARVEKHPVRASSTAPSAQATGDPDREARLEKALTELKKALKETLGLLRKS
ncbi:MAG TPA: MerR family transcriptional regulator [Patescibacteria group bacterium]|nr:MerR family transcriptional regulator [Patescibacteria group bacterium]